MKKFVWLSFDLGVQGDYEGLYEWLDKHEAKECGESIACFWHESRGAVPDSILKDLKSAVKLTGKTRVYVIWMADGKMKGRFIIGRRKSPPWTGYAAFEKEEVDSNE